MFCRGYVATAMAGFCLGGATSAFLGGRFLTMFIWTAGAMVWALTMLIQLGGADHE